MSRWTYQAELWAPWYYPYCTDIRLHQTTANLHQQFIKWNLPTFLDHIWSYSVSHLRCNNYNYLIFRWLLLSYTNSFPSPLSSVHTLNILAFLILYLFPFLKFCTFQQSNLCDETLLHHNSHTIHTIFPDLPCQWKRWTDMHIETNRQWHTCLAPWCQKQMYWAWRR